MKTLMVVVVLFWSTFAIAEGTPEETPEEDPYKSYWAGVFREPTNTWRLDLGYGVYHWDRVSDFESKNYLRLSLDRRFGEWFGAQTSLDWSWRTNSFGPLEASNDLILWGFHGGLEKWFGAFRLSAIIGGGPLIRLSQIEDTSGNAYSGWDIQGFGSTRFGAGLAIVETLSVGLDLDLILRPQHFDWSFGLGIGWLF